MHNVYFPRFSDSSMAYERNDVVGMTKYLNVVTIVTSDDNIYVRNILTLVLVVVRRLIIVPLKGWKNSNIWEQR